MKQFLAFLKEKKMPKVPLHDFGQGKRRVRKKNIFLNELERTKQSSVLQK
jgi:hypothetical protein